MNIKNKLIFLYLVILGFIVSNCGTVYVPQVLKEGRGISISEGQEKLNISVIPLTHKVIKNANEDNYVRRVVDSGDLTRAAKLVSVDQAIDEKIPTNNQPGPYIIGIGDIIGLSQIIIENTNENESQKIVSRLISVADDGFASIIGIGRIPLAGLTQFEAEDLIYERLVLAELNPEFEFNINGFSSKKIQITNNQMNETKNSTEGNNNNIMQFVYTNIPLYINEILSKSNIFLPKGQDSQIELIRGNETYRLSLRKIVEGRYEKIRLFPDDHIIVNSLPYRPETAVITGEVLNPRLYNLSASDRKTLSEALYSDETFNLITSDTSQIYLLRPREGNQVTAYHLDASNPSRLILANLLELRPGDIIFIAAQPITNYNRALMQIFGAYAMTINPNSAASAAD